MLEEFFIFLIYQKVGSKVISIEVLHLCLFYLHFSVLLQFFLQEYKYYKVPPYSDNFNKEAMIKFFEKQYANQQDDYATCEMDVDVSENGTTEKIILDNPQVSNKEITH